MSTLETFDELEQGSSEWLEARRGLVTASTIGQLVTATGKVSTGKMPRTLACLLAGERITGRVEPHFESIEMERGHLEEPIARALYAEHTGREVTEIGFMRRTYPYCTIGYSPDGLVGDDGLIEIKSRAPKKHLETIRAETVPAENWAQVQCGLLVSGREWLDYVSYCGGMRPYVIRVHSDPAYQHALIDAAQDIEHNIQDLIDTYEQATDGMPETKPLPTEGEIRI